MVTERSPQMIPKDIVSELPLLNLTYWNAWSTDLPKDALSFACDMRHRQATDSMNPLMSVIEVRVQGFSHIFHVRQAINECIGMMADFYLGGMERTCSEPQAGECVECREAIRRYFLALENSYMSSADGNGRFTTPFADIMVRQPAMLSWKDAFDGEGRFAPKAIGMSYDLNDAFRLIEDAVREHGGEIGESVVEARDGVGEVLGRAVREKGMRAEDVARGWREGHGPTASVLIKRWSSEMLDGKNDGKTD